VQLFSGTHQDDIGVTIAEWFGAISGKPVFGSYSAMGWSDPGGLKSAAIFNDYTGSNLEIHIVGRMTRQTMREAFRYVFDQVKVIRLTAKPHRSNKRLLRMLPKIGFKFEATLKHYYGPERKDDAIVFRMDRDAALKWMK
jgi:hypothetical protein